MGKIYIFFQSIGKFLGICMFISCLQWLLMIIYNTYCHNDTIYGVITNMLTLGSPLCSGINKVQQTLNEYYIVYLGIGTLGIISGISNCIGIKNT